jgi:hypothetical protein
MDGDRVGAAAEVRGVQVRELADGAGNGETGAAAEAAASGMIESATARGRRTIYLSLSATPPR